MSPVLASRRTMSAHVVFVAVAALLVAACSPGTLPGTPSPILSAGGGARYNGSITYRRVGGTFIITETRQDLRLSLVVGDANQITGRFETAESSGTVQGTLNGSLASGRFDATILLTTTARQGATTVSCEGQGQVIGVLSGLVLTWTDTTIRFTNCDLTTTSTTDARATSPLPGFPTDPANRAVVTISIVGGASVSRSTCGTGAAGYPFTVEMAETAGIDVTWDSSFRVEERRNFGSITANDLDMPFTALNGGSRRTYSACSTSAGTYQAFFSGTDAGGNRVRVATPLVTFLP